MQELDKIDLIFIDGQFSGGGAQRALMRYEKIFSDFEQINTYFYSIGSLASSSHLNRTSMLFSSDGGNLSRFFRFFSFVFRSKNPIFFVTSIGSFFVMAPIFLLFSYKAKLVYRYIQLPSLQIKEELVPKYRWFLLRILRSVPDLYISQTDEMKHEMSDLLRIPESKIAVIGNWVDDPKSYADVQSSTQKFPKTPIIFGVFGRIVRQKGIADVVDALKLCVDEDFDFVLRVYGEDIGGYKASIENKVASLGLDARVTFIPYESNVPRAMADCDVIVNASYAEGYPNILIEALAAGKRVIFSRCVQVVEDLLLRANVGRCFDVGDVTALAEHMRDWQSIKSGRYLVSKDDYDFEALQDLILGKVGGSQLS